MGKYLLYVEDQSGKFLLDTHPAFPIRACNVEDAKYEACIDRIEKHYKSYQIRSWKSGRILAEGNL